MTYEAICMTTLTCLIFEFYRFQADYQLGVLISRSSINLIKIEKIEILAALQVSYMFYIVVEQKSGKCLGYLSQSD